MEKIKSAEYEEKKKSAEFVIMDFSSPGCAPCQKIPPLISRLLEQLGDVDIKAFEINVVDEPEIAQKLFILGVPTLIVFKNGREIKRFNAVPKIEKIIESIRG
jgi:thioredoxin 1